MDSKLQLLTEAVGRHNKITKYYNTLIGAPGGTRYHSAEFSDISDLQSRLSSMLCSRKRLCSAGRVPQESEPALSPAYGSVDG